jgi:hypothetical protein
VFVDSSSTSLHFLHCNHQYKSQNRIEIFSVRELKLSKRERQGQTQLERPLNMDWIEQAQTLANAVSDKVQEVKNAIDEAVDTAKNTAVEITTSAMATANELTKLPDAITQQGLDAVQNAREALDGVRANATGVATSAIAIADALKDLPKTTEALAQEMPKIARRLRNGAGVRVGDSPRSDADVMKLFEKIPGTSKLEANEIKIRQFLADKHGSHIVPRSQGGANAANNILWEVGTDNIHRGAKAITGGEQIYIQVYNAVDSIVKNSATIAKLGVMATGTAILTQGIVTAISYCLDLCRGDITADEYKDLIIQEVVKTGISAPVFFLILIATLALFPELTLLLSAPVVVAGFNTLFGISLAAPVLQSIIRHAQAGGFGGEVAAGYQDPTATMQ